MGGYYVNFFILRTYETILASHHALRRNVCGNSHAKPEKRPSGADSLPAEGRDHGALQNAAAERQGQDRHDAGPSGRGLPARNLPQRGAYHGQGRARSRLGPPDAAPADGRQGAGAEREDHRLAGVQLARVHARHGAQLHLGREPQKAPRPPVAVQDQPVPLAPDRPSGVADRVAGFPAAQRPDLPAARFGT